MDKPIEPFTNLPFLEVADKHAPIMTFTVGKNKAPWTDKELKALMAQRDKTKMVSIKSGNTTDWKSYCSLRNQVKKINGEKKQFKKLFFW